MHAMNRDDNPKGNVQPGMRPHVFRAAAKLEGNEPRPNQTLVL
jgi:hypothetical protein